MKSILSILCLIAFTSSFSQLKVEIDKLSINSEYDEFAPTYYKDGLIITSNKKSSIVKSVVQVDRHGNEIFLNDIYYVSFKGGKDSIHNGIKPLSINKIDIHDGPVAFYKDSLMALTRMQLVKSKNGKKTKQTKLGLFFFTMKDGEWISQGAFQHNSSQYTISQPSFSSDGNTLYYVSNKKGGIGGMDIWKSKRTGDFSWSEPINLGDKINTTYNDAFPFINEENILYFSSNRPGGEGGYDVYYIDTQTKILHTLETPINSDKDEFGIITKDNGHSGFFSTNREQGNDDIFFFRRTIDLPDNCKKSTRTKMCYTFYDKKPFPTEKKVDYIWDFGDGTIEHGQKLKHCYNSPGEYKITLSLYDSASSYLTENSSELELKIEESSKYYFKYKTQSNNDLNILFLNSNDKLVANQGENMYWRIDNRTLYDHDQLNFNPKYSGQYAIKGYLKEKNNLICITDTLNIEEGNKSSSNKTIIHLVYKKEGRLIPDEIRMMIFMNMSNNPKQENYKIFVPETVTEEWKTKIIEEFKTIIGKEIVVEQNRKSQDLLLKIYE